MQIGLRTAKKVNPIQANIKAESIEKSVRSQRQFIPDEVFVIEYNLYGHNRHIDLRRLLEIDVHELNELTLNNLRVQIEQIASIRTTIAKAKEQLKESFNIFKINYNF